MDLDFSGVTLDKTVKSLGKIAKVNELGRKAKIPPKNRPQDEDAIDVEFRVFATEPGPPRI